MKLMLSTLFATALIATACGETAPEPRGAVTAGCVGKSKSSPVCQTGAAPQTSNTEGDEGSGTTRTPKGQPKTTGAVSAEEQNGTLTPTAQQAPQQQSNSQNGTQNILGGVVGSFLPTFQKVGENLLNGLFNKPSQPQGQNQPTGQQQTQPAAPQQPVSAAPQQPVSAAPRPPVSAAPACPLTCNKTQLSICLNRFNRDSCYEQNGCTTGCR